MAGSWRWVLMLDDSLSGPSYLWVGTEWVCSVGQAFVWGACVLLVPFGSLEQRGAKMVRAWSRIVSHCICLPQLSNREGGGVWIEPQDKEYAAADRGDQNKQLCPQENELHIPVSDPTSNSHFSQVPSPTPPPYVHTQYPQQLEGPPSALA